MQDSLKINQSSYLLNYFDSTDVLSHREVSFTDDITTLLGSNARAVTTTTIPSYSIDADQSIVGEVLGFTIISGVVALYMLMWLLCGRVIPNLFKSFTYKDIIERLIGMFDVNMERLLHISNGLVYIAVAYAVMVLSRPYVETIQEEIYVFGATLIAGIVYWCYNFFVVKLLQYISENEGFCGNLTLFNRSYAAVVTIIFLPIVILMSFVNFEGVSILAICLITILLFFIIHYLLTLFRLFKQENISFLEYILYLCGAELIPISFVVIFTLRNYVG